MDSLVQVLRRLIGLALFLIILVFSFVFLGFALVVGAISLLLNRQPSRGWVLKNQPAGRFFKRGAKRPDEAIEVEFKVDKEDGSDGV